MRTLGLFYSLSKHNCYLRSIFQGIHQSVIIVYGYAVDNSVPEFFVKFYGRSFKLGEFKEHTTDGRRSVSARVAAVEKIKVSASPQIFSGTATGMCSHMRSVSHSPMRLLRVVQIPLLQANTKASFSGVFCVRLCRIEPFCDKKREKSCAERFHIV